MAQDRLNRCFILAKKSLQNSLHPPAISSLPLNSEESLQASHTSYPFNTYLTTQELSFARVPQLPTNTKAKGDEGRVTLHPYLVLTYSESETPANRGEDETSSVDTKNDSY